MWEVRPRTAKASTSFKKSQNSDLFFTWKPPGFLNFWQLVRIILNTVWADWNSVCCLHVALVRPPVSDSGSISENSWVLLPLPEAHTWEYYWHNWICLEKKHKIFLRGIENAKIPLPELVRKFLLPLTASVKRLLVILHNKCPEETVTSHNERWLYVLLWESPISCYQHHYLLVGYLQSPWVSKG